MEQLIELQQLNKQQRNSSCAHVYFLLDVHDVHDVHERSDDGRDDGEQDLQHEHVDFAYCQDCYYDEGCGVTDIHYQ